MGDQGQLRIVVACREFWPAPTDDSLRLQWTCRSLVQSGARVTVLTQAPHRTWPDRLRIAGIDVRRIVRPKGILAHSALRSAVCQAMAGWAAPTDILWLDDDSPLARGAAETAPISTQVFVRYAPGEHDAASTILARWRGSLRRRWTSSPRWIVGSMVGFRQLLSTGIARDSIRMLASPCTEPVDRTIDQRRNMRRAMADANHDLFLRGSDRLIVCWVQDCSDKQLEQHLWQLGEFADRHRDCRIWLIPTAGGERRVHRLIQHQGWHRLLAIPGCFADPRDLLQVADLCILLTRGMGLGWYLPWAVGSGVPILAADSADLRAALDMAGKQTSAAPLDATANPSSPDAAAAFEPAGRSLVFSEEDSRSLGARLDAWWQDSEPWVRATELLRRGMVHRHWEELLLDNLCGTATLHPVIDSA